MKFEAVRLSFESAFVQQAVHAIAQAQKIALKTDAASCAITVAAHVLKALNFNFFFCTKCPCFRTYACARQPACTQKHQGIQLNAN